MKNLIGAILALSLLAFAIYQIKSSADILNNNAIIMKSNIGKQVIIENDTLIILDYSLINETYLLSNGVNVNRVIVEKK